MSKSEKFVDLTKAIINLLRCSKDVACFISAQCMLETGYLTSDICLSGHNLFGMRVPKFRLSFCNGEYKKHAYYSSFFYSVLDYALWLCYNGFIDYDMFHLESFMDKLGKSKFNPSDKYVTTIYSIYLKYCDYE